MTLIAVLLITILAALFMVGFLLNILTPAWFLIGLLAVAGLVVVLALVVAFARVR